MHHSKNVMWRRIRNSFTWECGTTYIIRKCFVAATSYCIAVVFISRLSVCWDFIAHGASLQTMLMHVVSLDTTKHWNRTSGSCRCHFLPSPMTQRYCSCELGTSTAMTGNDHRCSWSWLATMPSMYVHQQRQGVMVTTHDSSVQNFTTL